MTANLASARLGGFLHQCAWQGLVLPFAGASGISLYALVSAERLSLPFFAAVFLCVYASYMIDHLAEVDKFGESLNSERSRALRRKRLQVVLAVGAFLAAVALSAVFSGYAAALLLVFPTSVAFYGTLLLGKLTDGRLGISPLKDIPYLKSFYTAFFWGVLALFAALFLGEGGVVYALFFFGFFWSRFFVNTVFCDLKDVERDREEGVLTFAAGLGVERTLHILRGVNVLSMLALAALVATHLLPLWMLPVALVGVYTHWLLGLHASRRGRRFSVRRGDRR